MPTTNGLACGLLTAVSCDSSSGRVSCWARPYTEPVLSEPAMYGDTPAIDYAYALLHDDLARLHLADAPRWQGGL